MAVVKYFFVYDLQKRNHVIGSSTNSLIETLKVLVGAGDEKVSSRPVLDVEPPIGDDSTKRRGRVVVKENLATDRRSTQKTLDSVA